MRIVDEVLRPPSHKGRHYELRAQSLRDFAGLRRDDEPLDPFELARYAKIYVADFEMIEGLAPEARAHLLGDGAEMWSGGTCARPLPNGWRLVILNPSHAPARHNATLMEEICHVFLGHKATRLSVLTTNKTGQTIARDYNDADEEAAYAVGAAALVPYSALHRFIQAGESTATIARRFDVSRELVAYRAKVSRLWADYRRLHPEEGARGSPDARTSLAAAR